MALAAGRPSNNMECVAKEQEEQEQSSCQRSILNKGVDMDLYCTDNDCYRAGAKIIKVEYLIVHSPAVYPTIIRVRSGAGGGWYKRWNKPGVEKLVHGFIDDTGVYNFAPETMACWHIGNNYGNARTIGYELCELSSAGEFAKVWDNAVSRYAALCKKYRLGAERILGHCEAHDKKIASNHSDPEPYFKRFGKSMEDFRADAKKHIDGAQPGRMTAGCGRYAAGGVAGAGRGK